MTHRSKVELRGEEVLRSGRVCGRLAAVIDRRVCMSESFVCRNQSCGTPWEQSEVVIKNEGQGPLFRCPLCGARNYLEKFEDDEGNVVYEQVDGKPFL
jgi:hypothetical protein